MQTQYINFRNYLTYFIKNRFTQYGVIYGIWNTKTVIKNNENSQKQATHSSYYLTNGINFGIGMTWG